MKHIYALAIFFALTMISHSLLAQRNCGTMEILDQQLQENPRMQYNLDRLEEFTQDFIRKNANEKAVEGAITIPVVVHVVYNTVAENISDAQVQSQIDVLNEDFRRTNEDAANTPSDFVGVAADTEIQFCLASVAPDGSATNGITRTETTVSTFGTNDDMKFDASGGKDAWPADQYLNIWVCDLGNSLLGYAQFPGGSAATDGVVCNYLAFGRGPYTLFTDFALGRTTTHEVGHWLNLRHIWGDGPCSFDDFVDDTPEAGGPNYTGSPCTYPGPNSCRPRGRAGQNDLPDMFQNYMDYSDDVCMNLFTIGQTERMRALFDTGGPRAGLLTSNGCGDGGGTGPICGNGSCESGEDCSTCPGDCGDCNPVCGDGICESGEDCSTCSADCGDCPPATCSAPANLTSSTFGNPNRPKARLSWDAVSGANSYTVEWGPGGNLSNTITTTGTTVTIDNLTAGQEYSWQVTADCGEGGTATAGPISFTGRQNNSPGSRLTGPQGLRIFPNPAANLLTVEFSLDNINGERASIQINDVHGRIVNRLQVTTDMNYV